MNLKDLFRVGTVTGIDDVNQSVRVTFDDLDDTVSPWMQVSTRGAYKDDDYWMPDPDEQVMCMFMPTGNAEGYVLFSVRGTANTPKAGAQGKRYVRFGDGAVVEYDRSANTMTINVPGPVNITANGNVNVTGDVIADGISLKTHVHGGVTSGGSITSSPQ